MTKKEARKKGDEELCDGVVSVIEKMVEGRKIDRKQADKYYWGLAKFLHLQDLRPGRYGLMLIPNKVVQEHIKDKLVAIQTSREWRKKAMNGSRPGASIPGDKPPKVAVPMNKLKSAMV